tara:strand:- start:670 stop:882 length:213 start_codon:yes stop_codon:yes gene_type:complete
VKPIFDELSEIYAGNKHVTISAINGDDNKELLKEKNIKGYPTIMLTYQDKDIEYKGERTAQKLQEFIQSY